MIKSMTAFARNSEQLAQVTLSWEIRSVNHRYLEATVRLPDDLRHLEFTCRDQLRRKLLRGKVDCSLRCQVNDNHVGAITINPQKLQQLSQLLHEIQSVQPQLTQPTTLDILNWPGLLDAVEQDRQTLAEQILGLFQRTLADFIQARAQEGQALIKVINERLQAILTEVAQVKIFLQDIIQQQRQKILQRFAELKLALNQERIEQELVLIAQRMDVTEELDRITIHVHEFARNLQEGEGVGRRLDFLLQELNREANTLAAKSIDIRTAKTAIELKVLIEQIREQVQNIE